MVRQGHLPDAEFRGGPCQKRMPCFASAHFERQSTHAGLALDLSSFDRDRQTEPGGDALNQTLVCRTAAPAQLMVQMRYRKPPTVVRRQVMEDMQQHHRV